MSTTTTQTLDASQIQERIVRFRQVREAIIQQIHNVIIGQDEVIEQVLIALFVGGHCLITGLPGTANTLLVRTIGQILGLEFRRIQFTPDLMPSDITGTDIIEEDPGTGRRTWTFVPGPIFANILLADEINRTPPKTPSALLEAMQKLSCTVRGNQYKIRPPFFVLATQNPIELEGTYPLTEAQLDRFMFNIVMTYLSEDEEVRVVTATTGVEVAAPSRIFSGSDILEIQQLVRQVVVAEEVARYAVRLVDASRPGRQSDHQFIRDWVKWGAGLRASQALILAGKARALILGRYHVSVADIQALARPVLRHRVIPNFYAESERITADNLVERLLEAVPIPRSGMM